MRMRRNRKWRVLRQCAARCGASIFKIFDIFGGEAGIRIDSKLAAGESAISVIIRRVSKRISVSRNERRKR